MPKENIAFVSLLKPVDDIRSYHKLALSLSKHTEADIHLFGYPTQSKLKPTDRIHFHPSKPFPRISFQRLIVPYSIFKRLLQLKPKIVVVNSPELLWVTIYCKILFGTKIIYDIQENYFKNLWFQNVYPPLIKHVLALTLRLKEVLTAPVFDHFLFAEKCYSSELKFINNRYTVLENKALSAVKRIRNENHPRPQILFSGTITENTGIYEALSLVNELSRHINLTLRIVGHCPEAKIYRWLKEQEGETLSLHIDQRPIPYSEIEEAIKHADAGLVCYRTNPSNQHCMPTKVFEYAASGLPIMYEEGSHWQSFIKKYTKGLPFDFNQIDQKKAEDFLHASMDRSQELSTLKALWEEEEIKWIDCLKKLKILD
ncbi:glycosyltransferase family protein [Reichenbachiella ulvae]|uniref:Spore protein YkvP/CgeB glycosyl transferase-like domain-containing protein n=1 Tax=Reichenbachiella ulvae TaxID=2980104 RepID=A0ABT3CQZ3_9BACT|nr:hypothetical protein [Reichenbachiella ulvae]MCV9386032.1 hypothetical protein [Reichenbachiella ulvae]